MAFAYLEEPSPFGIAHRGGNEAAPENTVAAFQHAVDRGYSYLETDVHLTRDGVLVAFHDAELERVAGVPGSIADHSWEALGSIDLGDGARIPSMDELLATFPRSRFNIDPKSDEAVDPLVDVIRRHDAIDRVCIGAFSDDRIRRASELLGPRLCTSTGPRHTATLWAAMRAGRAIGAIRSNPLVTRTAAQHGCLQVPPTIRGIRIVDTNLIEGAHELGLQVHVWTINEPDEMRALLAAGVDAIITDKISVLSEILRERDG
jgi:glycerophosphoryl diester phosphodiesterase